MEDMILLKAVPRTTMATSSRQWNHGRDAHSPPLFKRTPGRRHPELRAIRRAFTLIELLVVMSIISILLGVLMPSMSAARQTAQAGRCLANLRRISSSSILYLERSDGRFPPFRLKKVGGATYVNGYGREKPRWQWFLGMDIGPVINPPTDSAAPWGDSVSRTMTNEYFICPSLTGPYVRDVRNGAYGYNYQYLGNSRTDSGDGDFDHFPVSENDVTAPALTILVADSRGANPDHGRHSYTLDPPRLASEKNAQRFGPGGSDGPLQHSPAEARHLGKAVVSFVDGHAEKMTLTQMGYELDDQGIVRPDEDGSGAGATNRLWTGEGRDPLETAARN